MNDLQTMTGFKNAFNKVVDKIVTYKCAKSCYMVFEKYLTLIGVPEEAITDIYKGSGFNDWDEIYSAREINRHSIPVRTSIGKIKGISSAINKMLEMHIAELGEVAANEI